MDNQDYHEETQLHEEYNSYQDPNWKLVELEGIIQGTLNLRREWLQKYHKLSGNYMDNLGNAREALIHSTVIEELESIMKDLTVIKNVKVK